MARLLCRGCGNARWIINDRDCVVNSCFDCPERNRPPMRPHPMQEIEQDARGVMRFRANKIVQYLLDRGPVDMNHLGRVSWGEGFTSDDWDQFNQLIGYSVSGCPLVNKELQKAADIEADKVQWAATQARDPLVEQAPPTDVHAARDLDSKGRWDKLMASLAKGPQADVPLEQIAAEWEAHARGYREDADKLRAENARLLEENEKLRNEAEKTRDAGWERRVTESERLRAATRVDLDRVLAANEHVHSMLAAYRTKGPAPFVGGTCSSCYRYAAHGGEACAWHGGRNPPREEVEAVERRDKEDR